MAREGAWEGYRDGRQLEHLLQRLDAQERRRVGRALAGRGRLQRESDAARALQELLVAAVGGRAQAEEIVRGNRRFQHPIENPNGDPPTAIFPVDGRIGERTRYLRRHVRDSRAIEELQRQLWEAGLYRGRIDGIPGQLTLAALARAHGSDATFQRVFGVARARPPPREEGPPPPVVSPPPHHQPLTGDLDDSGARVSNAGARAEINRHLAEMNAEARLARAAEALRGPNARVPPDARLDRLPEDRAGNDYSRSFIRVGSAAIGIDLARDLRRQGRLLDLVNEATRNLRPNATEEELQAALGRIDGLRLIRPQDFTDAVRRFREQVQGGPNARIDIPASELLLQGLSGVFGGSALQVHAAVRDPLAELDRRRATAAPAPDGVRRVPTIPVGPPPPAPPGRTTDWQRPDAMAAEEGGRRLRALEAERTRVRREQEAATAEGVTPPPANGRGHLNIFLQRIGGTEPPVRRGPPPRTDVPPPPIHNLIGERVRVRRGGPWRTVQGRGEMDRVTGFIVHHTAGRGTVQGVLTTFVQRNVSTQFIISREIDPQTGMARIYRVLPDGQRGNHIVDGYGPRGRGRTNRNHEGVEVIALNDQDVLPEQVRAIQALAAWRAAVHGFHPQRDVLGHGEVNPGRRPPTEGMSGVNAIRASWDFMPPGLRRFFPNLFSGNGEALQPPMGLGVTTPPPVRVAPPPSPAS